jgi:hypothetical protein
MPGRGSLCLEPVLILRRPPRADLFARLSKFFGPPTPIANVGDRAYFDKHHRLYDLVGKVRFYIAMDDFTPAIEKQLENLASQVGGRL